MVQRGRVLLARHLARAAVLLGTVKGKSNDADP